LYPGADCYGLVEATHIPSHVDKDFPRSNHTRPQFRKDYKPRAALFMLFAAWFLTQEVNKGFE